MLYTYNRKYAFHSSKCEASFTHFIFACDALILHNNIAFNSIDIHQNIIIQSIFYFFCGNWYEWNNSVWYLYQLRASYLAWPFTLIEPLKSGFYASVGHSIWNASTHICSVAFTHDGVWSNHLNRKLHWPFASIAEANQFMIHITHLFHISGLKLQMPVNLFHRTSFTLCNMCYVE